MSKVWNGCELHGTFIGSVCPECTKEHIYQLTAERDKLLEKNIRLDKMANYYRHKCKIYGGVLAQDGPLPTEFDLALLKQLEEALREVKE